HWHPRHCFLCRCRRSAVGGDTRGRPRRIHLCRCRRAGHVPDCGTGTAAVFIRLCIDEPLCHQCGRLCRFRRLGTGPACRACRRRHRPVGLFEHVHGHFRPVFHFCIRPVFPVFR